MKDYVIPVVLAGLGVGLLFHNKNNAAKKDPRPPAPLVRFRSWKNFQDMPRDTESTPSLQRVSSLPIKSTPPSPPLGNAFDRPYIFFHEKLTDLDECLQKRNCPIKEKGPKDYDAAIYSEMLRTLKTLSAWQNRHKYQDHRIPELMADFLVVDNAYIKIEALKILGTQSPTPENLDLLLDSVLRYPQPEVIPLGIKELARYKSLEQRQRIDDVAEQVFLEGGVNSALELAKGIKPLLTSQNRNRYISILNQLSRIPLSAEIAQELGDNL
jgi:hypothetical protein